MINLSAKFNTSLSSLTTSMAKRRAKGSQTSFKVRTAVKRLKMSKTWRMMRMKKTTMMTS